MPTADVRFNGVPGGKFEEHFNENFAPIGTEVTAEDLCMTFVCSVCVLGIDPFTFPLALPTSLAPFPSGILRYTWNVLQGW